VSDAVLDASALLALLNGEPGQEVVAQALGGGAVVGAVNFSEVVASLVGAGMPAEAVREALDGLELDVVAFDLTQAYATGLLRSATRDLGLSLGDRACLALAALRQLPALTADRAWASLDVGVAIRVIR
jgi:PIN domain nuclease of toxin-antitoxin system